MPKPRPAVFLDRDGTLNFDPGYIHDPEQLHLLPGAAEGLRKLMGKFPIVVVTNQSGISRGIYTRADVASVHARLGELLAAEGARVDAIYFCPHQTADKCDCRKPMTGMFRQAAQELDIDLANSWMVGDRSGDIEAGLAVGARTILLPEAVDAPPLKVEPHFRAQTLSEAADIILQKSENCQAGGGNT